MGARGDRPTTQRDDGGLAALGRMLAGSAIPSGIASPDGRFTWVNEALCAFVGRDEPTLLAGTWHDITYPGDRASDEELAADVLAGTLPGYRIRKRYVRPDGAIVWGDLTVTGVSDDGPAITHLVRQVVDITASVAAEEALAASWTRFSVALQAQLDAEVICDAVRDGTGAIIDLRYVEANEVAAARLGKSTEELIGHGMAELFPTITGAPLWKQMLAVVETGVPLREPLQRAVSPITGAEHFYEFQGVKVGDGIALSWRDITDAYLQTQEDIRKANELYHLVVDNAADVVFHARNDILEWVSPAVAEVLGWAPEEMIGRRIDELWQESSRAIVEGIEQELQGGGIGVGTIASRRRDGSSVWLEVRARTVSAAGDGRSVVGMFRDVSERVAAETALRASEGRYRLLAENIADVVATLDSDWRFTWVSESVQRVLGWPPEELLRSRFEDLVHPDSRLMFHDRCAELVNGTSTAFDLRVRTALGAWRWLRLTVRAAPAGPGTEPGLIVGARDVTDWTQATRRLDELVGHDALTGLPNREALEARLAEHRHDEPGHTHHGVLLCIGIDRLSRVNLALGHTAGDLVVTTVARRIAECVPDPQLVGRGSGVDFLVAVPNLASVAEAVALAERIRQAVKREIVLDDHRVQVTASIGIVSCEGERSAPELVRAATQAMNQAKAAGRDRLAFDDPSIAEEAQRRLTLAELARDSISQDRFIAWFMPIVDLRTKAVVGHEALVRWDVPGDSMLGPNDFLSVLDDARIGPDVDLLVLRQALDYLAVLPEDQFVSVNVSPGTLAEAGMPQRMLDAITASGITTSRVHLELTETVLFSASPQIVAAMQMLADAGMPWYVDDFGTGYSSITHLRELPISGLKLDKSFVQDLTEGNHVALRLTQALAGLAAGLELDTVAEGVSDATQAAMLEGQGWARAQGWLYGVPAPRPQPPGS